MEKEQPTNVNDALIFKQNYSYRGSFVPIPNLTVGQPYVRSTYSCPDCHQPYSGRRLDQHKCQKHLAFFTKFKRSPNSDRYLYRCMMKDCNIELRLGHTAAHYQSHKSRNPDESTWEIEKRQFSEKEILEEIHEEPKEEEQQKPAKVGKYYFSSWERCYNPAMRADDSYIPTLVFLAILFKQTRRKKKIVKRTFVNSVFSNLIFPKELKEPHPYAFSFRYIYFTYVKEAKSENGSETMLIVDRERVRSDLKKLLKDYFWTDEEIIAAGRFRRVSSTGPRRHKIPEENKGEVAVNKNYRFRHKRLVPLRNVCIKKYRSTLIFKKYYDQAYLKYRFRIQRVKQEEFRQKITNVFEDPISMVHYKQRQKEQHELFMEVVYRRIADFLSVERYHLEYMGLFEYLTKERFKQALLRDLAMLGKFRVDFPVLYRPEDMFVDKEWFIIAEDFFNLFKNWFFYIAEEAKYQFDEKITFPKLVESQIIEGAKNWLIKNKLWMTIKESKGVYQEIDIWDQCAVNCCWRKMRQKRLEEFKRKVSCPSNYKMQNEFKIGSEFKIVGRDHIILRQDTRPVPLSVNPIFEVPRSPTYNLLSNPHLWELKPFYALENTKISEKQLCSPDFIKMEGEVLCALCSEWVQKVCYSCTHCGAIYHQLCLVLYLDKQNQLGKCPRCRDIEPKIIPNLQFFDLRELMIKRNNKYCYKSYPYRWFRKLESPNQDENIRFTSEVSKLQEHYKCQYMVFNSYLSFVRFYPAWNTPKAFNVINHNDYKDLCRLNEKGATLPITMQDIPAKGKGLRAVRDIQHYELVAVYSGVVMSSIHAQRFQHLKDYLVAAFEGPGTHLTAVIVPHYFAGFGHVLNGAPSQSPECNCQMANFLCANGLVSLIRATRFILKDQELQWNYNGRLEEYNMNFEKGEEKKELK